MFSPAFRFLLVVAAVVVGWMAIGRGSAVGWVALGGAVLLAVGFWRSGSVWLAWRAYQAGDEARLARRLRWTGAGTRLSPRQRAYYDFLSGVMARRSGDSAAARRHFGAAADGSLPPGELRGAALAELAEAALHEGDFAAAREAIGRARGASPPEWVQDRLAQLEQRLAWF